ncbi:tetratricopeptide repeat protein [Labrys okinawensis]|nr:SEL1-like repeat protein [Labrys okinawensis]
MAQIAVSMPQGARMMSPESGQDWKHCAATLAAVLFLAFAPALPAKAGDAPGTDLRAQALELYPADDISSADRDGAYDVPAGAKSEKAYQARKLLTQASAGGDKTADRLLAQMLEVGAGGRRDRAAARIHYARSGNRAALWRLGLLLLDGKGGPRNLPLARMLFKQSDDKGQIDASYEYARMVELGLGGPKDPAEARAIYEKTLKWCHGDIADRYARLLDAGLGGPPDPKRAGELQLKAVSCHNRYFEIPAILARPLSLHRETIRQVQRQMKADGDYDGAITGRVDAATRRALRKLL